jgi:hypothetical protein
MGAPPFYCVWALLESKGVDTALVRGRLCGLKI